MAYAALDLDLAAVCAFLLFSISFFLFYFFLRGDIVLMRGWRSEMTVFQVHRIVFTYLHFVHCVHRLGTRGNKLTYNFEAGLHFLKCDQFITASSDAFE